MRIRILAFLCRSGSSPSGNLIEFSINFILFIQTRCPGLPERWRSRTMRVDSSRVTSSCSSPGSRSSRSRSSWRNRRRTGAFFFTYLLRDELPVAPLGPLGECLPRVVLHASIFRSSWRNRRRTGVDFSLLTYLVMTGLRIRNAFFSDPDPDPTFNDVSASTPDPAPDPNPVSDSS